MVGLIASSLLVAVSGLAGMTGLERAEPSGAAATTVARGGAVTIDGTIGDDEWKGATSVKVGANEYLLQVDGEHLCVAVRGVSQAILTVGIESEKGVRILHASASLGEAGYEKQDSGYSRVSDFAWKCSDNSNAAADARAKEREGHLAKQGWLGATIGRGDHQPEMKIRLADLKGWESKEGAAITVNVFSAFASGKEKGKAGDRWPQEVKDDTAAMGLRMGNAPAKAAFAVETWGRVRAGT